MKIWARFFPNKDNQHKSPARFRLVKHSNIINNKPVTSFDIQKKNNFLFFEWWETVDTGYRDIRKARRIALAMLNKEKKSQNWNLKNGKVVV